VIRCRELRGRTSLGDLASAEVFETEEDLGVCFRVVSAVRNGGARLARMAESSPELWRAGESLQSFEAARALGDSLGGPRGPLIGGKEIRSLAACLHNQVNEVPFIVPRSSRGVAAG
jgi:hypothetical protein